MNVFEKYEAGFIEPRLNDLQVQFNNPPPTSGEDMIFNLLQLVDLT